MTVQANMAGVAEFTRQAISGIPSLAQTAAGTGQSTALLLPSDFVVFTTVASSTGCQLPFGVDGTTSGPVQVADDFTVVNHGANTLSVYPQSGGKIANGSANAAFSVPATKTAFFVYIGSGNWAAAVSN